VGCGTCALGRFPVSSFQYADDADVMRGKHQIAFGVDFLRTREIQENHYNDNGVFNFSGQYGNDPLLDFLTGKMNNFNQRTGRIVPRLAGIDPWFAGWPDKRLAPNSLERVDRLQSLLAGSGA
jgi:hypothetical protein